MISKFLVTYRQPLQWWWLWFVCACVLVAGLCMTSLTSLPYIKAGVSDKTMHFFAYWGVSIWWLQIFRGRWAEVIIVTAAICLGVGLEVAQSFHPLRHMDYRDAIANSIGVGLGYFCATLGMRNALLWLEACVLKLLRR